MKVPGHDLNTPTHLKEGCRHNGVQYMYDIYHYAVPFFMALGGNWLCYNSNAL